MLIFDCEGIGERRVQSGEQGRGVWYRCFGSLFPKHEIVRFVLIAALLAGVPAGVRASSAFTVTEEQGMFLHLRERGVPVFTYIKGEYLAEGVPEDRRRSTYVHPIYSLDGRPLSEDFPKDHYHHRGLSWMWLKVRFDGVTKDLWTLRGVRQKHDSHRADMLQDKAVLSVRNWWVEDSTGRKIIDEQVTFITHKATHEGRLIDFELTLAAVDTPVTVGTSATGYSGLNLRFAPRAQTVVTTSRGVLAEDEDRKRYTWADLTGRFEGSDDLDGIAIFENRSNPYFPTGWTLRNYGILNPAFTSTRMPSDYTIEPGGPLVLRYRIYVHKGKADPSTLHRMFDEYNSRG